MALSLDELKDLLDDVSGSITSVMKKDLLKAAVVCVDELDQSTKKNLNKRSLRGGRSRSGASGSSGLAGSWRAVFVGQSGKVSTAGAYSDLPYAEIH